MCVGGSEFLLKHYKKNGDENGKRSHARSLFIERSTINSRNLR